jgi:hypothetical protein
LTASKIAPQTIESPAPHKRSELLTIAFIRLPKIVQNQVRALPMPLATSVRTATVTDSVIDLLLSSKFNIYVKINKVK